jgi:hypothetical protein
VGSVVYCRPDGAVQRTSPLRRRRHGTPLSLEQNVTFWGDLALLAATGFTDELAAEAKASKGKIVLATLNDLYGQPS